MLNCMSFRHCRCNAFLSSLFIIYFSSLRCESGDNFNVPWGSFYKVSTEIKDCHSQHLRIWEWHFGGLDVFLMEDGWAAALQAISFLPSLSEGRGCPLPGPARTVFSHLQRVGGLLSFPVARTPAVEHCARNVAPVRWL